jgi:hypothetical protein
MDHRRKHSGGRGIKTLSSFSGARLCSGYRDTFALISSRRARRTSALPGAPRPTGSETRRLRTHDFISASSRRLNYSPCARTPTGITLCLINAHVLNGLATFRVIGYTAIDQPMTFDLSRCRRCESGQFQPKRQHQTIRMVAGLRKRIFLFAVIFRNAS